MSDKIKFSVDRRNWFRGKGPHESRLLRGDGKMCCLGFYALSIGFSSEEILDVGALGYLFENFQDGEAVEKLSSFCSLDEAFSNKQETYDLMAVNDNPRFSDEERERILTEKFADLGVEITFTN